MRRAAFPFVLLLGLAAPAGAGVVSGSHFVITDEIYDMERLDGGTVTWRSHDFAAIEGQTVGTQASLLFAADGGGISASDAENGGLARCMNGDYLMVADAGPAIASAGKPAIIDLGGVLFETVNGRTGLRGGASCNHCQNACAASWWCRLRTFRDHAAGSFDASTVLFFSLYAETTGSGIADGELDTAARQVKAFFPGVKVGAGYPTTDGLDAQLPASFVSSLDLVVSWDYKTPNPRQPPYSNPTNLHDPATTYGRLAGAAAVNHQGIYLLVSGFNEPPVTGPASEIEWSGGGSSFASLLQSWCALALKRNQSVNSGLIVWKYNDSWSCATGSCAANTCSGVTRFQTGAQTTFAYEATIGSTALARAYAAVSAAARSGGSCWAP
jgi:hypothetical protein